MHLGFRCVSALGPGKSSKTGQARPWLTSGAATLTHQPCLPWCWPGSGAHGPERAHLGSWWTFCRNPSWDLPQSPDLKPSREGPGTLSLSGAHPLESSRVYFAFLPPSFKGPLLPLWLVSWAHAQLAHFPYLYDFLNKCALWFQFLSSEFPSPNSSTEVAEPKSGRTPPVNIWCCFATYTPS